MKHPRSTAVFLAGLTALAAAACGSEAGTLTETNDAGGVCTEGRVGGTLTVGTLAAPQGLDPAGQPGNGPTGGSEITALFDTLMNYDTATRTYKSLVARSLKSDARSLVWTLTLRNGIRFGNGDPLTAQAVKASIERHQAADNTQASRIDAATIRSIAVVDPKTVRFTLKAPDPSFARILATDIGMITNPKVVAERGADFASNPAGAGVGPYELERYAPGDEIGLKARNDYWTGPVCIQTIRFVTIVGAQGTYDALQNGELNVAYLREPREIDKARKAGFHDLPTLYNYGNAVIMNAKKELPTEDARVRRAVVAALDPKAIDKRVNQGTGLPTSALIHEKTPGLYQGLRGPSYDPELAKRLVAEAKAEGWDGRIRLATVNVTSWVDEAISVKAHLEGAGFEVTTDTGLQQAEYIKKIVVDRDYDLALWGPNFSAEGLWSSMSRSLSGESSSNYYNYANPQLDKALAKLRLAATADKQKPILAEMQRILTDNPFAANLAAIEESYFHDETIAGLQLTRGSILRFNKAYISDS